MPKRADRPTITDTPQNVVRESCTTKPTSPRPPWFTTPEGAREYLEAARWPHEITCPRCGANRCSRLWARPESTRPARAGTYKCYACRKQFNVATATIFECSRLPRHKWLLAIRALCDAGCGIGPADLEWRLDVSSRTARAVINRLARALSDESARAGLLAPDQTSAAPVTVRRRGSTRRRGKRVRSLCRLKSEVAFDVTIAAILKFRPRPLPAATRTAEDE